MAAWTAHQLVEFLAAVTEEHEEDQVVLRGAELASETIGAEVGAAIVNGRVRATVGFGAAPVPATALESLPPGAFVHRLGILGECQVVVADMLRPGDRLVVARLSGDLGPEERNLLSGMAKVLGLVLRTLRALTSERELRSAKEQLAEERLASVRSLQSRQQLLETLLGLQRSISHRAPLSEILAAATSGARRLLGRPVWLYLDRSADPAGPAGGTRGGFALYGPSAGNRQAALEAGAAAVASSRPRGRPFAWGRTARDPGSSPIARVVTSTVHVGGAVTGALVAEVDEGDWDHHDQRLLVTFAEHVSMALTDAQTVAAVDEAFHDPLTDLPNRALFLSRVEHALAESAASIPGANVAVIFIDLDRFKAVNDTLGHAAGDALLQQVAARLAATLRLGEVAGRFGGDEFAVLLERVARSEEAQALAERVIERLREPFSVADSTVVVGASVGIALGSGGQVLASDLLRNADLAMYRAKKEGGRGWALFEPQMYLEVRDRVELEADLQVALVQGQIQIEYAPIVRLADEVVAAALPVVHWRHPVRGRIEDVDFVPLAEETGIVVEIGRFVLAESLGRLAAWRKLRPELALQLRVSHRQLLDPLLPGQVEATLATHGLPPGALTLAVREPTVRDDPANVAEALRALKALGVAIAVGGFGGGMASLAYLQELPIDSLQIDRTLVVALDSSEGAGTLARGVVELATALGLTSLAEGIETKAQLELLRKADYAFGHGRYFSVPLTPDAFSSLVGW